MKSVKPEVTLYLGTQQDIYHGSHTYAGLARLAKGGVITLRYGVANASSPSFLHKDPLVIGLKISSQQSKTFFVAIDLHDQNDVFCPEALEAAAVYMKRSYHAKSLTSLPNTHAKKIFPFGLNYGCQNKESLWHLLCTLSVPLVLEGMSGWQRGRYFFALPNAADFEQQASVPVPPTIVFQTRVWEAHDTAEGEADQINERRVSIIRALRKAFGDQFRGGLVPTPLAKAQYPDDISSFSSKRRLYTKMSKQNLIGIYTQGLHGSTAFKLPEYLAASQCIVAERFQNDLPAPLIEGIHYLPFETPRECVEMCRLLLDVSTQRAYSMRHANEAYYKEQVEPSAHLCNVLTKAGAFHASSPFHE